MTGKHLITIVSAAILLSACSARLNRLNKDLERTGRWVTWHDSAKAIKSFEGRFRNGRPVGKARYYNAEGRVLKKETNGRKKLNTVVYNADGNKRMKGRARVVIGDSLIRYYYYGKWKYFDELGKPVKYGYYENGRLIRTEYVKKRSAKDDTLAAFLTRIEQEFNARHRKLLFQAANKWYDTEVTESINSQIFDSDSATFNRVSALISKGYPGKAEAGEATAIPFYILSYGTVTFREQHLPILKEAAEKGDIERSSLARYIDKIKVAKGEPQVYGTQQFKNAEGEFEFYPSEDRDGLKERRRKAGLEPEI